MFNATEGLNKYDLNIGWEM